MWQLSLTNAAKEWSSVATFGTVTATARRIREIEGYSNTGAFPELHVDAGLGTGREAFSVPRHAGRKALYRICRRRN
jgi:hypothetical protein